MFWKLIVHDVIKIATTHQGRIFMLRTSFFLFFLSSNILFASPQIEHFHNELENLYHIQNHIDTNRDFLKGKIEAYHEVIQYLESFEY